jgi:DNA-binding IclR family transcriptional regulator
VLAGPEVIYIAREESSHPFRLVAQLGRRVPAQNSAIGKALLSGLSSHQLRELIGPEPFPALTATSLRTYEALEHDLEGIRTSGHGESREECIEGLHCISAAIRDPGGGVVAAMSISTPIFRMDDTKKLAMIRAVRAGAEEISWSLAQAHGRIATTQLSQGNQHDGDELAERRRAASG